MFTQCPHCNTVFRIYAEQLTQARGQVRCGVCDHGFNALENLSEHLDSFAAPSAAGADAAASAKQAEHREQEPEPQPVPEEISEPEPSSEAEHVAVDTSIAAAAETIEQPEHVDHKAHDAAEQGGVASEPSSEPQEATYVEPEPQPVPEEITAPDLASEAEHVEANVTVAAAAAVVERPEHIDYQNRSAAEQSEQKDVAMEPSSEPQAASIESEPYESAKTVYPEEPAPLSPVEPETTELSAPWEDAAVSLSATRDDEAETAPDINIIADATEAAMASANESPAATAPPTDRALPDLGIIAAEPRRISATETSGGRLKTTVWAVVNIALIVVLLGQYAYFNRNQLSQYPELRPWLTGFCAVISCNTPLRRDVSHIKLANRIVQSDPKRANALLINATLINDADFPQAYPLLEIQFSDLNNHLIAGRRFRPREYLPASSSIQAGMPPHQPVHITLEIVDPGKQAVSFQFELL